MSWRSGPLVICTIYVYFYSQRLLFNAEAHISDLTYHSHEVWVSHWCFHIVLSSPVKLLEQPAWGLEDSCGSTCTSTGHRLVPSHRQHLTASLCFRSPPDLPVTFHDFSYAQKTMVQKCWLGESRNKQSQVSNNMPFWVVWWNLIHPTKDTDSSMSDTSVLFSTCSWVTP